MFFSSSLRNLTRRVLTGILALSFANSSAQAQVTEERESEYDTMDGNLRPPEKSAVDTQSASRAIFKKTNAFREKHDLCPLESNATLAAAAQKFADKTGAYFAVQMLGRPEDESLQFRVVNESSEPRQYTVAVDGGNGTKRRFDIRPRVIRTHQRCRPVELTIPGAGGKQTLEAEDGLVVRLTESEGEGDGMQTEIDPTLKTKNSSPEGSR